MWEYDESDIIDEIERRSSAIIEEAFGSSINWLFDLQRSVVKPLYRVELKDGHVVVMFDIPGVDKDDVSLTATDDSISIEAKMKRPVSLKVGGSVQKLVEFERYGTTVQLPIRINPDKAKATIKRGILRVRVPLVQRGTRLKVE